MCDFTTLCLMHTCWYSYNKSLLYKHIWKCCSRHSTVRKVKEITCFDLVFNACPHTVSAICYYSTFIVVQHIHCHTYISYLMLEIKRLRFYEVTYNTGKPKMLAVMGNAMCATEAFSTTCLVCIEDWGACSYLVVVAQCPNLMGLMTWDCWLFYSIFASWHLNLFIVFSHEHTHTRFGFYCYSWIAYCWSGYF